MFKGGIADKSGNRYEAKWLVYCLLEVIEGKAKSIKFEGITDDFTGFEFSLKKKKRTEWHQTKINAPSGNWTIIALKNEGLLNAFKTRLRADNLADCIFVSQDNARDLRDQTEEAKLCENVKQYKQNIAKKKLVLFEKLVSIWEIDEAEAFDFLNRISVQVRPEAELINTINTIGHFFIQTELEIFPTLREYMEDNFNREIETETIRLWLRNTEGFQIKDWSLNPTIIESISNANKNYLKTYIPFGAGGESIPRNLTEDIIQELKGPDGAQLILLTGEAGSGKSGIIREIIDRLKLLNTPHLAFRIDRILDHRKPNEIGVTVLNRKESPVSILKGIYPDKTCVLIIDQVDAVSEVSGRAGLVKEAIFEMIEQAQLFQGVRVIVACRTFDLENDGRIRNLKSNNRAKQFHIPQLDWDCEVRPLLELKNYRLDTFGTNQRQLLLLPLNLAIFLEIDDIEFSFNSRTELYHQLIQKKERLISSGRKPMWSLLKPLTAIGNWMSKYQQLTAPTSVLDDYGLAEDLLASENLIIKSGHKVSFFHESFFDYIFARTFITSDQSLIDLLFSTEQHLFRRTQVRQILTSLREESFLKYLSELVAVINHPNIRYHIKLSVFQWLGSIKNPTSDELTIILSFDKQERAFNQYLRCSIFVNENWFDLLNDSRWISNEIENSTEDRKRIIFHYLSKIASEKPEAIAIILRDWWNEDSYRAKELLIWMSNIRKAKPNNKIYYLCLDVVRSHPDNMFNHNGRDPISMLIRTWCESGPGNIADLLKEIFLAWFKLKPTENPFSREGLLFIDKYTLEIIAEKAPEVFLKGTVAAFSKSISMIANQDKPDSDWYSFKHRTYSDNHYGFDEFLNMFRTCLKNVSVSNPQLTDGFLKLIDENLHECFLHLHLEVIAHNPKYFAPILLKLTENNFLYDAGYNGADWFSFAAAAKAAFPYYSKKEKIIIEDKLFLHRPEHDQAKDILKEIAEDDGWRTKKHALSRLNYSGFEQWCVLNTIGASRLTNTGKQKLSELNRKFLNKNLPHPDDLDNEAKIASSPIDYLACTKMKDKNWIAALKKYSVKIKSNKNYFSFGPRELSSMLMRVSEQEPDRYAALAVKLPYEINNIFFEHLILGLSNSEEANLDLISEVISYYHSVPEKPFGQGISQLVLRYPQLLQNNKIMDILCWYAEKGIIVEDEERELRATEKDILSISDLFENSRRLIVRNPKGVRGEAWEAIGNSLWTYKNNIPRITKLLNLRFKNEKLSSVRCSMIHAITPIFNTDKPLFEQLISDLIKERKGIILGSQRLTPIITHEFIRIVHEFDHYTPELSVFLIKELIASDEQTIHLIGCWWAFGESLREGQFTELSNQLLEKGEQYRSLIAGTAASLVKHEEIRDQATKYLVKLFNDENPEVRKKASRTFYDIDKEQFNSLKMLAENYIESLALCEDSLGIFCRLEEANFDVSDLALIASEKFLNQIHEDNWQKNENSSSIYRLQKLLTQEYASSEKAPKNRTKILNQIDFMLEKEIDGVDRILDTNDR